MIIDGRAFLGAVAHLQGDRFGSAGNARGERGVNLRPPQVFAEHFGLCFDVLLEGNAGTEALFHRTNAAGKSVLRVQLDAQAFLNLPSGRDLVKSPTADGQGGRLAGTSWRPGAGYRGSWPRTWRNWLCCRLTLSSRSRSRPFVQVRSTLLGRGLRGGRWRNNGRANRRRGGRWKFSRGRGRRSFSLRSDGCLTGNLRAGCGQLIVRHDVNNKNGLAGFDFVAGCKHRFLNLRAIQMGAVGAFLVNDAAPTRTALHREVHARHVIVVGNGELGTVRGAPDDHGLPTHQGNRLSGQRPVLYFQNDAQNRILTN